MLPLANFVLFVLICNCAKLSKAIRFRAAFLFPANPQGETMQRQELIAIVKQSNSTTLIANRMRDALGLPPVDAPARTRDRDAKRRKYRGYKKCMKQKHGVRL